MERHIMFIDWKTQRKKDVNPPPNWYLGLMQLLSESQQDFCRYKQDYSKFFYEKAKEL